MKYMGSKNRLMKKGLLNAISSFFTEETEGYWEPFVGGANSIDKIRATQTSQGWDFPLLGSDNNKYLIALLQEAQKDGFAATAPETISEEEYQDVKNNKENYPAWYVGLVGFCSTYGAKFFGGYARSKKANGEPRDMANEGIRNLLRQIDSLKGIEFKEMDYRDFEPENWVIYCDPPYEGTTGYGKKFDYEAFWAWAEKMSEKNVVLVSEGRVREGWNVVWSLESENSKLGRTKAVKKPEFLLTFCK